MDESTELWWLRVFGRAIAMIGVLTVIGGGCLIYLGRLFEALIGVVIVFVGVVVFLVGVLLVDACKWPWPTPDPGRRG